MRLPWLVEAVEESRNLPAEITQEIVALAKVGIEQAVAPARKGGQTSVHGEHSHNGNVSSKGSHKHYGYTFEDGSHSHADYCQRRYVVEGIFGNVEPVSNVHADGSDELFIGSTNSSHKHLLNINDGGDHTHSIPVDGQHSHEVFINPDGTHSHQVATQTDYASLGNPISSNKTPIQHGCETRPKNVALLYCIKY